MFIKRFMVIALSLLIVLVGVLAACAGPTSTPTGIPTPTLTPTATPTGPLAQIIAGAKKEGTVTVGLRSAFTPKSMERLAGEIKETFGVDLSIKFVPIRSYPPYVAQTIMEYQAGATPTFDLINFSSSYLLDPFKVGALERVDWKPLITGDTNPEVVLELPALRGGIIYYTAASLGLMYNPQKVPAGEAPETFTDLANPKWKGKLGIHSAGSAWARSAFIRGKDKTLADIRAILKNKPIAGEYSDLYNRYLLGEISLAVMSSIYIKNLQDKGMPVAWQSLELAETVRHSVVMPTGAAHPNAAKLVAVYLASPKGAKWSLEESGSGNIYYPGNFEHDIRLQNEKRGIPEFSVETHPELLDFILSEEFTNWVKEIELTMKTGG